MQRSLTLLGFLVAAAAVTPVHAQPVDYPALQITTPGGETSILLGTMHQGDARVPLPAPAVLEQAQRLVLESDPKARPLPRRTGGPPPDMSPPISMNSILDEEEKAVVRTRVRCRLPQNATAAEIEKTTSTILAGPLRIMANTVALCPTPGQPGVEAWLKEAAAARGVPLDGLEADWDSLIQWASLPDHIFTPGVRRVLSPQGEEIYAEIASALNKGTYETICSLVRANFASPADAELFEQRMVDERNALWMPNLERYLEEGQAVIMVGAAHLCGENGLPVMLTKRGYQIESIQIPAVARPVAP